MAITAAALMNLARVADLRITSMIEPAWVGQPHVLEVQPASLLLSSAGGLLPGTTTLADATPVKISVQWSLQDQSGSDLTSEKGLIHGGGRTGNPLQALALVVPRFVELRDNLEPSATTYYVAARATLTATSGTEVVSQEVDLPRLPITIPDLPIPTLVAFFAKPDFARAGDDPNSIADGDQFLILVVPEDSIISGVTALRDVCEKLQRVASTAEELATLAGAAGGLPGLTGIGLGVDELLPALNRHSVGPNVGVAVVTADWIRDLNNIDAIKRSWYRNDIEAEDTISSLLLFGRPGMKLRIFQHTNFEGAHATITTGGTCFTLVKNLEAYPPVTDPPGLVEQYGEVELDNRLSSIAFL